MIIHRGMPTTSSGFALPTVIVTVVVLMIVGMTMVQSVSSIRSSLQDQYYTRLARQAAESGVIMANYCLGSNSFVQSWGPEASNPNLTQNTDCEGDPQSPSVPSIINSGNIRTTFTVGDLEARSDGAVIIAAIGKAELINTDTGTASRSYTITLKQVVNWKEFKASLSASGSYRTCSIVGNELYCWGRNMYGQLGDGTEEDSLTPVKVVQETGLLAGKIVTDLFSAQHHNCALAEGKVYCWGWNRYGQLGNGKSMYTEVNNSSKPILVEGALADKYVTHVGGTGDTSCAIAEGKIYCWGGNSKGTVGNNSSQHQNTPQLVSDVNLGSDYNATGLSTSGSRSFNMCAIADGKAWCWGGNEAGQVGNNTIGSDVRVPTKVYDQGVLKNKTVTSISQDGYHNGSSDAYPHVCAVANSRVYCWGDNSQGQLGRGNYSYSDVPVAVIGVISNRVVQDVVVGLRHSCALVNSRVYCWGNNGAGQLGRGYFGWDSHTPSLVQEATGALRGKTVTAIGGGSNRGCAIADFRSYCWGLNTDGQIGDGTTTSRNTPTESIYLRPQVPSFIF